MRGLVCVCWLFGLGRLVKFLLQGKVLVSRGGRWLGLTVSKRLGFCRSP